MNENNNHQPTEAVDYSFITNQPAAPTKKKTSKKVVVLAVLVLVSTLLVGLLSFVQSRRTTSKGVDASAEQVVRQLFVDMGNGDNAAALNAFTGPNTPDVAYLESYLIAPLKSDYLVDSCTFTSVETKAANYFQVQASCPQRQASNIRIRVDFTVMRQDQGSKIVAYYLGGVDT